MFICTLLFCTACSYLILYPSIVTDSLCSNILHPCYSTLTLFLIWPQKLHWSGLSVFGGVPISFDPFLGFWHKKTCSWFTAASPASDLESFLLLARNGISNPRPWVLHGFITSRDFQWTELGNRRSYLQPGALPPSPQRVSAYPFSHTIFTNFLSLTIHTKLFRHDYTHTTIHDSLSPLVCIFKFSSLS